jgi:putative ABC transport system permease protein
MRDLLEDLRFAIRILAKSPGFATVAVLAMALGIGANTSMFTFVNAYLLRALPIPEPDRLILISHSRQGSLATAPYPDLEDWRAQSRSFTGIAAYQNATFSLTGDGEPERYRGARVSAEYFRILGISPALGRDFRAEEDAAGGPGAVILGYNLWQTRYGGAPDIAGRTLRIEGRPHTVAGVLPRGIRFPPDTELYTPLAIDPAQAPRGRRFLTGVGRLKPGVAIEQARAEMDTIAARLASQYADTNAGWGVSLMDVREAIVRGPRPSMYILSTAVVFVLLIACANLANLLLARSTSRAREIAIRSALGAGRFRIVRQMLTESVLLALAGAALGLFVSDWGTKALTATMPSYMLPPHEVRTDAAVFTFTIVLAVLTGILFGLAPAIELSRTRVNETLKEGTRSGGGFHRGRLRSAFVVTEIAFSVMLLVGAGLLIKSFARIQLTDLGFRPDGLMTMQIAPPQTKYSTPEQRGGFFRDLLERLETVSGVEAAAATNSLPVASGGIGDDFLVEGRPAPARGENVFAMIRSVNPGYFRAMQIPIHKGRPFTAQDGAGALPVAIVNETFASRIFPNEDPVGRRIRIDADPKSANAWLTIAGVAADVRHYGVETQPYLEIYQSYLQAPPESMYFALRARSGMPVSLAAPMRAAVRAMDRDQPVANLRSMERVVADRVAVSRTVTMMLAIFAGIALLLAVMGVYGVVSYSVGQRRQEIGVRMALGANGTDVVALIVRHGLKLAAIGVVLGVAGAFAITRLMAAMLYGVSPRDLAIFVLAPAILTATVFAASYFPARRAARIEPVAALRYE